MTIFQTDENRCYGPIVAQQRKQIRILNLTAIVYFYLKWSTAQIIRETFAAFFHFRFRGHLQHSTRCMS